MTALVGIGLTSLNRLREYLCSQDRSIIIPDAIPLRQKSSVSSQVAGELMHVSNRLQEPMDQDVTDEAVLVAFDLPLREQPHDVTPLEVYTFGPQSFPPQQRRFLENHPQLFHYLGQNGVSICP